MNKKFEIFCAELLKWGKIHNLTSYKNEAQIYENIEDSIYPLDFMEDFKSAIDIGSGSGFPAIPLAIKKADSSFILLEPNAKKAAFLRVVSLLCELGNVCVIRQNVEDFKVQNPNKKVDLITSRALFESKKLIDLSKDLLNENGRFLFYKGEKSIGFFGNNAESRFHTNADLSAESSDYIKRKERFYFYKKKAEVI